MRSRITRQAISKLAPTPGSGSKQMLWDTEVPGFGAYRNSGGRVSLIYQYRMPGDRTIRSKLLGYLGEITLEDARSLASKLAFQRRQGIDPILDEKRSARARLDRERLRLDAYAADYLQRRIDDGNPHNKAQTAIIEKDVVGILGAKRIDEITIDDLESFSQRLRKRAPSAVRMGLVYLKIILNDAKRRGRIQTAPTDQFPIPKAGVRRRRLRETEVMRFLEAARDIGDARSDILEVLLRTCKRKDEVRRMQWEEIDLQTSTWTLPAARSKNRRAYVIHLPRQVAAIIERQQPDPRFRQGPVFTLNGGKTPPEVTSQVKDLLDANMHRRVKLANDRDGRADSVEHFTFHDLRTTVASRLQEAPFRISKDVLDAVLLHSGSGGVVEIYATAQLEVEAGEAIQQWNDWLDALMIGTDAFPGGAQLPKLKESEVQARIVEFRRGWPERADQQRARARREGDFDSGYAPRGRKARAEARRRAMSTGGGGEEPAL